VFTYTVRVNVDYFDVKDFLPKHELLGKMQFIKCLEFYSARRLQSGMFDSPFKPLSEQ